MKHTITWHSTDAEAAYNAAVNLRESAIARLRTGRLLNGPDDVEELRADIEHATREINATIAKLLAEHSSPGLILTHEEAAAAGIVASQEASGG